MENDEKLKTEEGNITEEAGVGTQANQNKDEVAEEAKFTQEEVNAMMKKQEEKFNKKIPDAETLKAFNEWKENQKTEKEKQAEKEAEYANTLSKNLDLEKENKTLKAGVNIEDMDYVIFKVSKMKGEFEENLESFLKENPKYLSSNKEDTTSTINLGGEHKNSGSLDLSKMSYEEYVAYRKKQK